MSITRLPSGRYRAQVPLPGGGKVSVAKVLDAGALAEFGAVDGTFARKRDAQDARAEARRVLRRSGPRAAMTVAEFRERWLTDPLFARPKQSTMLHNAERTRAFAGKYGGLRLGQVGDAVVAEWLTGGRRNSTVMALRAMFNDAASAKAGRLITANPFTGLGIEKGAGNKHRQPVTVDQLRALLTCARELTPASFADYLEAACATAMRPGELDALRPERIRWADHEIDVVVQWSARVGQFTEPKKGRYTMALTAAAREVLERAISRDAGEFVFVTLRGSHYSPSARTPHWNRVRDAAGLSHMTLYVATRHYFAWHAVNVLGLDTAIVAEQLGHRDGGLLVEQLYGHPDKARRRRLLREAHDAERQTDRKRRLRVVDSEAS